MQKFLDLGVLKFHFLRMSHEDGMFEEMAPVKMGKSSPSISVHFFDEVATCSAEVVSPSRKESFHKEFTWSAW